MAGPTPTSRNATSDSELDPTDHLPLSLHRSELIPAAPNRSESSIDWLPDFAGYSWIAYGSSSLLVISHFPSPLSPEQTLLGPIFRQVFELSSDASSPVNAVCWSPVTPSAGELAAASGNCIFLFSHDLETSNCKSSFCWSQNAVLLQCTKVEAVEWTASGDGILAGGLEVILWKRKSKSWEIAWKFKADQPQNLVSASWSTEGPSAAASYSKALQIEGGVINEPSKSVLVFYSDGNSEFAKAMLCHPQPVSMIQWRPSGGKQLSRDAKHLRRHILLTCCLDGTVRLWSEVDDGRVKKAGKDGTYDHKTTIRSFYVAAVIEIDCALRGTLGVDIFLKWATEIGGLVKTSEETKKYVCTEGDKREVGRCEWLIGFGPGKLVTFWAIHCLDDMTSMRFPRVTLWKRHKLQDFEVEHLHRNGISTLKQQLVLKKVVIMRTCLSGPPTVCSLIHLFPFQSMAWSMLYTKMSNHMKDASPNESRLENLLSCSVGGILDIDGHTGKILQVAIHPYVCEVELAVSLDSNGLLLFWSLSTNSNSIHDLPTLIPTWKICGKYVSQDKCSKYTSLRWAPLVLGEDRVLLMGHVGGIDCFAVKIFQGGEDDVVCHYICTIPFTGHDPYKDGPTNIYSVPLSLSCNKTSMCDGFLLLGIWMKEFQALSWEIKIHAYALTGSYSECNFDDKNLVECSARKFENMISGTKYCVHVIPSSAQLPEPHLHDLVTSSAVICPSGLTPMQQMSPFDNDPFSCKSPAYVMATGCSDGGLKLWRFNPYEPSISHTPWELVGMFTAHQGPVSAICLTNCGRKIATIGSDCQSNAVSNLRIWDSIRLADSGTFMLEDTLSLNEDVVALNWLNLGNGQLLLAVCMHNEIQVYAQKRCGGQALLNSKKPLGMQIWFCIGISHTFPAIHDFLWGPRTTGVVVHACYLSLLSPWLFLLDKKHQTESNPNFTTESLLDSEIGMNEGTLSETFNDRNAVNYKEKLVEKGNGGCNSGLLGKITTKDDHLSSTFSVGRAQLKQKSKILLGFWSMLDIVETLAGVLPVYHPEALFANIYSGNWKRAYISVRHLVEYLNSSYISEKIDHHPKCSDIVPQIPLSNYIEGILSNSSTENAFQWNGNATSMASSLQFQSGLTQFAYNLAPDSSSNMLSLSSSKSGLRDFLGPINKLHELSAITAAEKMQILAIIDLLNEVSNPQSASVYKNLDEPGRRFWVTLRFQQLLFSQSFGRSASLEELVVDSGLMVWAFHSDCQETLFGSLLPNEPSWQEMRTLGVGFWFTNATQLRTRMEKLARSQYLKKRDPKDCTLLYVALNRLQVLAGLFKISKDEKDKPLVGFLSRNFQEEKNKAAALKNAYVLMGRHQLELAIAFFLLGGDTSSAVTVCAKNLGDEQLALIICRLVEGRGGPLERHLITKTILPSAIERSDYWLASLLEWELGNYLQSFLIMVGLQVGSAIDASTLSSCHVAFMDPSVGLYCLTLANNASMRNAVGDQNARVLARWASLMSATSLNRCGLPLEALESLSLSLSILGGTDRENVSDIASSKISLGIWKPSIDDSSNWLLGDVALHLESYAKLDLALQYISKLIREHPSWPRTSVGSVGVNTCSEDYENQYDKLLENFQRKLCTALAQFEQKFSLVSSCVIDMIFVSLCNNGFWFLGYDILHGYSHECSQYENHIIDSSLWYPLLHKPLLKVTEDISFLFSHFIAACSITWSASKSCYMENGASHEVRSNWLYAWGCYFQGVIQSLWNLKAAMRIFSANYKEADTSKLLTLLEFYEYYAHFASAWLQKNSEGLVLMMQPLLVSYTNGHTPYEVDMSILKKVSHQVSDTATRNTLTDDIIGGLEVARCAEDKKVQQLLHSIPEDERWHIIGAFLWQHMSRFMKHKLDSIAIFLDDTCPSGFSYGKLSYCAPGSVDFESDTKSIREKIRSLSWILAKLLKIALEHISSYTVKQLVLFLQQKIDNGFHPPTLVWLEESKLSSRALHQHLGQGFVGEDITNSTNQLSASYVLWNICADPTLISESFAHEKINWSSYFRFMPSKGWGEVYKDIKGEHESHKFHNHEGRISNSSSGGEAGSPSRSQFRNGHTFPSSSQKDAIMEKEVAPFQNPKEIYKRNGELLEALCVNSIDQRQAALASSRKGIIFFNWDDGMRDIDQSDYIWSGADWPHNGWAGCESTPVPTCVSPGLGLGNNKGAQLGLGGATIGVGSLARPGRDLTGGGAFGIPGYAGIGASGLGWEVQGDFEEFVDPPATVENISTRAISSHPSRPVFLVGSINTHIYLWEYGKDKATATYGVLPAANVPPPYALASISALQFDHCGHRFATAALDGTVCAWQLEVGGRSNIRPTESSLCFNNHASDVTYVTSSGSIIAAAGCSSNGVNVVIWDTLAPPATSRASIICHEGGARSIAVFDNDIGSGSISPLIVTGGKNGDVGLHDFRYIATGRTKRHRHHDSVETSINRSSSADMRTGASNQLQDQNHSGMLWYIPKAHLGSITKISTIPNTSLFLTGSKDGDVKLWDAKAAKLVYHWSKLHERHTFLQPSSRGFGGVVRAAVTDIQVVSHGFLSCGGDGSVKLVQLNDYRHGT